MSGGTSRWGRLVKRLIKHGAEPQVFEVGTRVKIPANIPDEGDREEIGNVTRMWSSGMVEFRVDRKYWAEGEELDLETAGFRDFHKDLLQIVEEEESERDPPQLQQAYWSEKENNWVQDYEDATFYPCITQAVRQLVYEMPGTAEPEKEFVGISPDVSRKWLIVRVTVS